MYATEVGKGLPNNYVFGYSLNVSFDKKHKLLCWSKGHIIQSLTAQI